jgi:hypothetical protein
VLTYLNERDYPRNGTPLTLQCVSFPPHDEKNFAVVISYDHAEKFKKAGIDNPADYYMGKKLRVTGKVIAENDQVRIRADDPAQIKIVDEGK